MTIYIDACHEKTDLKVFSELDPADKDYILEKSVSYQKKDAYQKKDGCA